MIEKLKNLDYVSLKELEDLDKMELLFVDIKEGDVEPNGVFCKTIGCGSFEIDNLENVPEAVEQLFVQKLQELDIAEIDTIDKGYELLDELKIIRPRKNKFILAPKGSNIKDAIETEYLVDEAYFGYKVEVDEPGIVLVTNEDGLKDKTNIRFGIIDIGFFPDKMYYKMKIS